MKRNVPDSFTGYRVDRYFKRMEIFTFSQSSNRLISRIVFTMRKGMTIEERFKEVCKECRNFGLQKPRETYVK